jgi:hypothetical protein
MATTTPEHVIGEAPQVYATLTDAKKAKQAADKRLTDALATDNT